MEDFKQLLADFDRWTGKGNLIQANQTAAKMFRLLFEAHAPAPEVAPVVLTRSEKTIIAHELEWERVVSEAAPTTVTVPPVFEETVTPAEALAAAASAEQPAATTEPKPAKKRAAPKKGT